MKKINIAIDGYSGCGKSSTAKALANRLEYTYIDTGAMYRATTLYFMDNHITITNPKEVEGALNNINIRFVYDSEKDRQQTYLNGVNVEDRIRGQEINDRVSEVSAISAVRRKMVDIQRKLGKDKGVVMDGRDIGTVVFPDAELKLFMKADIQIRTERRQKELMEKDILTDYEDVKENLLKRDKIDAGRADSPLTKAVDAIEIDTTHITFEEQVEEAFNLAISKMMDKEPINVHNGNSN